GDDRGRVAVGEGALERARRVGVRVRERDLRAVGAAAGSDRVDRVLAGVAYRVRVGVGGAFVDRLVVAGVEGDGGGDVVDVGVEGRRAAVGVLVGDLDGDGVVVGAVGVGVVLGPDRRGAAGGEGGVG